jgi:hypothetical protein
MKSEPLSPILVSVRDWAVLQRIRADDFFGHSGFDRMVPADHFEWLQDAVMAFVFMVEAKQWLILSKVVRCLRVLPIVCELGHKCINTTRLVRLLGSTGFRVSKF